LAMKRRTRWVATASAVVVVLAGTTAFLYVSGNAPAVIRSVIDPLVHHDPPTCPLTGQPAPNDTVPERPALAIKVENLPAARPQSGVDEADIVYEEPVEAGITRFIAVFQCQESKRVGPVRSGRITDIGVLAQYGKPIFGYAGGANLVVKAIDTAPIVDESMPKAPKAYVRDPNRLPPHNLYTNTEALRAAANSKEGAPDPVFTYDHSLPGGAKRARTLHIPFSGYSDVYWKWQGGKWLRTHGTVPHTLENGDQVSAKNVVIQVVKTKQGPVSDVNGVVSPEVIPTGGGKAYVCRNGHCIQGSWKRPKVSDLTVFEDRSGDEIPLQPGNTWVELVPAGIAVTT
jgi:DUF3048 family protein